MRINPETRLPFRSAKRAGAIIPKALDIHEWMSSSFEANSALIFLELGAHHGEDTAKVLEAFPAAYADIWECDPRCLDKLNGRWQTTLSPPLIRPYAVGAIDGRSVFYQSGGPANGKSDWDWSGSLRKPTRHLIIYPTVGFLSDPVFVQVKTLDGEYGTGTGFDFIWVDIQGGEMDMIRGGQRTLRKSEYIYMETDAVPLYEGAASAAELVWEMGTLGFVEIAKFDNNTLFRNKTLCDSRA